MKPESEKAFPDIAVSLFAAVLGIAGLGLAWRKSAPVLGVPPWIGEVLIFAGVLVFAWIAVGYGVKIARSPHAMRAEIDDLVRMSFFAAVPLGILLLAAGALPLDRALAMLMWCIGAALQFILLLTIMVRWTQGAHARHHLKPSVFLPTAGILLAPATGVTLGFTELSWMMFATGLFLWVLFLVLLFDRMIFDMPLQEDELPMLAIPATPPALAFMSYIALTHQVIDGFARILFYVAVFFAIFLVVQAARFARTNFTLAWWAFTFPAAAIAAAMMDYRILAGTDFPIVFCAGMLALASFLVGFCSLRTLLALR